MSGAIVVNGLERHLPGLAKMKERLIIVRATGTGQNLRRRDDSETNDMSGDMSSMSRRARESAGDQYGAVRIGPRIAHDAQRRVSSGHHHLAGRKAVFPRRQCHVAQDAQTPLRRHHGNRRDRRFCARHVARHATDEDGAHLVIPPAARAEFVVTGPRAVARTFERSALIRDHGRPRPGVEARGVKGAGRTEHTPETFVGPLTVGSPLPQNVYTTALPPIAAKRTVVFSEGRTHFFINGKAFKMSDPPQFIVHVGTVEEWDIYNVTRGSA